MLKQLPVTDMVYMIHLVNNDGPRKDLELARCLRETWCPWIESSDKIEEFQITIPDNELFFSFTISVSNFYIKKYLMSV